MNSTADTNNVSNNIRQLQDNLATVQKTLELMTTQLQSLVDKKPRSHENKTKEQ